MPQILDQLKQKVLLCDGAHGTLLQQRKFDVKADFLGLENCYDILNQTRPDIITDIHRDYLMAGADCIETDTFSANKIVLADFNIVDKVYELNLTAAKLTRKIADEFSTDQNPRFVIGSMGPGTKLPSLDQVTYDELVDSYAEQARGLLDGQVDLLLLETHQDLLTLKAAVWGCHIAKQERQSNTPIFAQVTLESTGTTLVGSDMHCVITSLSALPIDGIGLNCGLGPAEMSEHVKNLSAHWSGFISVMPNAGLPILVDGQTTYPLQPEEFTRWQQRFVNEFGANLIGGCCGTTPKHIAALRVMLDGRKTQQPVARHIISESAVSSLFNSVTLRQENAVFAIGERANANGSKKFRALLCAEDFDSMAAIAKAQTKEGACALDICTAYVGRNEQADMTKFIALLRGQVTLPLVIDSTNVEVIANSLKLLGGKSIINSINFEDGEEKALAIINLAKQFGAAVIGLTIDENGMAKTLRDKIKIAKRLYDFAVTQHQLPASDLLIDHLTFTICTGTDDDREHAITTLEAIKQLSQLLPECQILLGLSNVSFGLTPVARRVLNSVVLHHAQQNGLNAAIMHASKIMPLHKIPDDQLHAAENLIFNRREDNADPLLHFINLLKGQTDTDVKKTALTKIEDVLKQHIIDGNKQNLKQDLDIALKQYSPADVINQILLDGMKTVGEYFGGGQMQLPFVLQSAETMKAAVKYLEPLMTTHTAQSKGTMVLATVKSDVHDIGKNLVDIILSNNGYTVINIGIKQSVQQIIDAAKKHNADVIGMSGLLVNSTIIMKENLEEMQRQQIHIPVILGGAALTRDYVEKDCQQVLGDKNKVYYAKDAFAGLQLMDEIL
ncbi:MAG: hypothetical protein A3C55_03370 [Gammaproteobacteria bacterium RIFCSPHIGHO2_02_FULL_42_13]|nr:MAG: hypothetical protein A3C55_03370 [Gammaproteobacteria bacterium RIFCSPHIGHO2_02_FULL_42_13]OGT68438.1 MAG: hypothetical protein A3H43_04605 [Gammaproteobacteria bacterium RIFCSPLOWO2_02_FULL_42_9]